MKLISNRGNIDGVNLELENTLEYVEAAINLKHDVKIDLWSKENKLYLGNDGPKQQITVDWLEKYAQNLWVQCRDEDLYEIFYKFDPNGKDLNYFYCEDPSIILTTSTGVKIAILSEDSIVDTVDCYGVCLNTIKELQN